MDAKSCLAVALLGAGVTLAGCEVAEDGPLLGPGRSFADALEIGQAQWEEVGSIAASEGPTRWVELPLSGSGAYRGVVTGWASGGVPVGYVADLALVVDFDRLDVAGSVANMVTDGVAGFAHPEGEVALSGAVARDGAGATRIVVDGAGPLRGTGVEAEVAIDGAGTFVGAGAGAMRGQHATDFAWTRGPIAGTASRSDGVFTAVRE